MRRHTLERLLAAREAKRPVALITWLGDGRQRLAYADPDEADDDLDAELVKAAGQALRSDRCRTVDTQAGEVFLQVFNPPLRMIVVGAVHIAQALVPLASVTGYEVTVVDPRQAFASPARFPDVRLLAQWPDVALQALAADRRTAVVTLTHDPKLDDPALAAALRSPAFYIGSLGSRRTHAARLERLAAAGFDAASLARIHGPIGEPIGATSPSEVAIAIMAQVTRVLRRGDGA